VKREQRSPDGTRRPCGHHHLVPVWDLQNIVIDNEEALMIEAPVLDCYRYVQSVFS